MLARLRFAPRHRTPPSSDRRRRSSSSPMADVAFLLLIFFLVAATIDTESGLRLQLPPTGGDPPPIAERNLLTILVRTDGAVLLDGQPGSTADIAEAVQGHVANEGRASDASDSPQAAIVSFKAASGVRYGLYISALDEVLLGYRALHDRAAREQFGAADYAAYRAALAPGQADEVVARYPVKLSLAEPDRP